MVPRASPPRYQFRDAPPATGPFSHGGISECTRVLSLSRARSPLLCAARACVRDGTNTGKREENPAFLLWQPGNFFRAIGRPGENSLGVGDRGNAAAAAERTHGLPGGRRLASSHRCCILVSRAFGAIAPFHMSCQRAERAMVIFLGVLFGVIRLFCFKH